MKSSRTLSRTVSVLMFFALLAGAQFKLTRASPDRDGSIGLDELVGNLEVDQVDIPNGLGDFEEESFVANEKSQYSPKKLVGDSDLDDESGASEKHDSPHRSHRSGRDNVHGNRKKNKHMKLKVLSEKHKREAGLGSKLLEVTRGVSLADDEDADSDESAVFLQVGSKASGHAQTQHRHHKGLGDKRLREEPKSAASQIPLDELVGDMELDEINIPSSLEDFDEERFVRDELRQYGPADVNTDYSDEDEEFGKDEESSDSAEEVTPQRDLHGSGGTHEHNHHPRSYSSSHSHMKKSHPLKPHHSRQGHSSSDKTPHDFSDMLKKVSRSISLQDDEKMPALLETSETSEEGEHKRRWSFRRYRRRLHRRFSDWRARRSVKIWMDDVRCTGRETSLANCRHRGWGRHNCHHREDAGVCCRDSNGRCVKSASNGNVEGGVRLSSGGRLEVYHARRWGTVCNDHFGRRDAEVVCRQLGFTTRRARGYTYGWHGKWKAPATNPKGAVPIVLDDVRCKGTEKKLTDCQRRKGSSNCNHYKDVRLCCRDIMTGKCFRGDISQGPVEDGLRLTGMSSRGGRLEMYTGGMWGTVCIDNFDMKASEVACRQLGIEGAWSRAEPYPTRGYHMYGPAKKTSNPDKIALRKGLSVLKDFFTRFCKHSCNYRQGKFDLKKKMEVEFLQMGEQAMAGSQTITEAGRLALTDVLIRNMMIGLLSADDKRLRTMSRRFCQCPSELSHVDKISKDDGPQEVMLGAGKVSVKDVPALFPSMRMDTGRMSPTSLGALSDHKLSGIRTQKWNVKFKRPFNSIPTVNIQLGGFDVFPGTNSRMLVSAESVSATGFVAVAQTWGSTICAGSTLSWTAVGKDRILTKSYREGVKAQARVKGEAAALAKLHKAVVYNAKKIHAALKRTVANKGKFTAWANQLEQISKKVKSDGDRIRSAIKPSDIEKLLKVFARLRTILEGVRPKLVDTADKTQPLLGNMRHWVQAKGKHKYIKMIKWCRFKMNQLRLWESKRLVELHEELRQLWHFHSHDVKEKLVAASMRLRESREKYSNAMGWHAHGGILCECTNHSGGDQEKFPQGVAKSGRKVCACQGNAPSLLQIGERITKSRATADGSKGWHSLE